MHHYFFAEEDMGARLSRQRRGSVGVGGEAGTAAAKTAGKTACKPASNLVSHVTSSSRVPSASNAAYMPEHRGRSTEPSVDPQRRLLKNRKSHAHGSRSPRVNVVSTVRKPGVGLSRGSDARAQQQPQGGDERDPGISTAAATAGDQYEQHPQHSVATDSPYSPSSLVSRLHVPGLRISASSKRQASSSGGSSIGSVSNRKGRSILGRSNNGTAAATAGGGVAVHYNVSEGAEEDDLTAGCDRSCYSSPTTAAAVNDCSNFTAQSMIQSLDTGNRTPGADEYHPTAGTPVASSGKRCVLSPSAALPAGSCGARTGAATAAAAQQQQPQTRSHGVGDILRKRHGVRRPTEKAVLATAAPIAITGASRPSAVDAPAIPEDEGEAGATKGRTGHRTAADAMTQQQHQRRSSGESVSALAARPKTGGIDRSKFILAHTGVLTDFYDIDSATLGQGSYGSVAKARKKHTGQMRAIKTISKTQVKNLERFRQEIAIMKELDHPNVVKLFETFEDHRNIYLVMELCSGGELFDRIISEGRLTEKQAAILMKQMFSAVHYLHTNHIMHRDLKPENFLFLDTSRESPLKIIDFGLSCRFKHGEFVSTKAGTPYYVAPQVLQGKYDYRCDAWSLGVILYILLCGYPPFYGETDAEVLAKVKSGSYSFSGSEWKRVSEEAKDLIRSLICFNPQERYTAEQALQHSWITTLAQNSKNVALPTTLMSNLKAFRAQNKLKKAALTVIAQHMSEKDIDHLRQIFMSLDVDNSGTLSLQEVREGLKRLGWTEIPLDLQAIIEEVDSDRSGHIDYTEFIAATMDKKLYMKEDVCWAAFRVFDLDGNGKISQDELKKVLGMPDVETAVGRATIDALLNEVDLNGDGEIDFDEFMHMMRKKDIIEKRIDLSARKVVQPLVPPNTSELLKRHTISRPQLSSTLLGNNVDGGLLIPSLSCFTTTTTAATPNPAPRSLGGYSSGGSAASPHSNNLRSPVMRPAALGENEGNGVRAPGLGGSARRLL